MAYTEKQIDHLIGVAQEVETWLTELVPHLREWDVPLDITADTTEGAACALWAALNPDRKPTADQQKAIDRWNADGEDE